MTESAEVTALKQQLHAVKSIAHISDEQVAVHQEMVERDILYKKEREVQALAEIAERVRIRKENVRIGRKLLKTGQLWIYVDGERIREFLPGTISIPCPRCDKPVTPDTTWDYVDLVRGIGNNKQKLFAHFLTISGNPFDHSRGRLIYSDQIRHDCGYSTNVIYQFVVE
jgi:hypothetical protein